MVKSRLLDDCINNGLRYLKMRLDINNEIMVKKGN